MSRISTRFSWGLVYLFLFLGIQFCNSQEELRDRIDDKNGKEQDFWIYNDISKAKAIAIEQNKPLFVTFRCVPCEACRAFDAEVASGNHSIRKFALENFISVRQVEMKNVDLSLFEFDHDLNWAAMFIHPDGTVYARYGTQSVDGPDAYNSISGLLNTMKRVLVLHQAYPGSKKYLVGKRRSHKPRYAIDLPGLKNAEKLEQLTTRSNCVHCHTIHDAAHLDAQAKGRFNQEMLWKYPLPDNLGFTIDPVLGNKIKTIELDSAAAKSGLEVRDEIKTINGQFITSIADVQWVLNQVPNAAAKIEVQTSDGKKQTISVSKGWKEYDVSWRGSMWSVSPKLRVWAPVLEPARRRALKIPDPQTAFLVKWINRGTPGGQSAFKSGLRQGDIIVEFEGNPITGVTPQQFHTQIKLKYRIGDELPIAVLRQGKKIPLRVKLVE
ncbi:MAG: Trx7/PDZ domain-containing (seleno)protein [Pirellulaceae bacterium]|nr:Trx7/PDZ domain-containing (seleno)protein [Pirellulaceae bacterium]